MKLLSLLLPALLCSQAAFAGDLRLTLTGSVSQNFDQGGPYFGMSLSDHVRVEWQVNLPEIVVNPGAQSNYAVDSTSLVITREGFPFAGSADPGSLTEIFNNSPADSLAYSTPLGNGFTFSAQASMGAAELPGTSLSDAIGRHPASGSMSFSGPSGFVTVSIDSFIVEDVDHTQSFCDGNGPSRLYTYENTGTGSGWHIDAIGGDIGQFGYFLVGDGNPTTGVPLGTSQLCLALTPNQIGRYNVAGTPLDSLGQFTFHQDFASLGGNSATGYGFDLPSTIPLPGSPTITAGSTWHFQLWYRTNGGSTALSNGVSITF
ncbi:MAG: hypothetical protein R3F17_06285 [Planctomycetota bacterium]